MMVAVYCNGKKMVVCASTPQKLREVVEAECAQRGWTDYRSFEVNERSKNKMEMLRQ